MRLRDLLGHAGLVLALTGCEAEAPSTPAAASAPAAAPAASVASAVDDPGALGAYDADYLSDLALVHLNHAGYAEAFRHFEAAVAKTPDGPKRALLYERMAEAQVELGERKRAAENFARAAELFGDRPEGARVWLRVGRLRRDQNNPAGAAEAFEKALKAAGDAASQRSVAEAARVDLLRAWRDTQLITAKLETYRKRLAEAPEDLDALRMLAEAHWNVLFEPTLALDYYRKLVELQPQKHELRQRLATLHFHLKQHEAGIAILEAMAKAGQGDAAWIAERLSAGYASLGDRKASLAWAQKMTAAQPGNIYAEIRRAQILAQNGEVEPALSAYRALIDKSDVGPQRDKLSLDLARLSAKNGRIGPAMTLLEKLRTEASTEANKKAAAALLASIKDEQAGTR